MDLWKYLEAELFPERAAKSALTLSDFNSVSLKREEATAFINQVVDESVLLKACRVHQTDSPSGNLSKLSITGPVTERATENTDSGNTYKPTNSVVAYATVKTRSAIDISGEVQEDTIEGTGAQGTIMNAMVTQVANDMEMLSVEGDDSTVGSSALARLLVANDGWHVQTASGSGAHLVDCGGKRASYKLLGEMLLAMPTKWRKNLNQLRWILSPRAAFDITEEWGGRVTDLGDSLRQTGQLPPIHGVQPLIVPFIPEDLTISGTASTSGSFIWLTNPANMIYVVQRDVTIEWERVPRSDKDEGTIHMRTDFVIEEVDAIAKAINVNTDRSTTLYGA